MLTSNLNTKAVAGSAGLTELIDLRSKSVKRRLYTCPKASQIKISNTEWGIATSQVDQNSPQGHQAWFGKPGGLGS